MAKIIVIPKERIKQYTKEEKEKLIADILKVIVTQHKELTGSEFRKLFKNIYNLGLYRFIELDRTYRILSTGELKPC